MLRTHTNQLARIHALQGYWWLATALLALLAHGILLTPTPLLLKALATLILAAFLPGALFVEWLVGRSTAPPTPWERILYSVGTGYANMVLVMLGLSYLPGGVAQWQTLLAFDLVLGALMVLLWLQPRVGTPAPQHEQFAVPFNRCLLIGLLSLGLIGGFLRLTNLGYAEFQGDEARLALRAAEIIQGYENALLIHKKGPTETLLPTVIYVMADRLNEVTARLPFSVANLTGLFALFLLGRWLFGPAAGWAAAILLALDGYLVAFGRVVQYQSIVFLMDVLVVLVFVRLWRHPKALVPYLTLAAILLATGLLSHYEAALVLFPVSYLLWRIWREGTPLVTLARSLPVPILIGGLLLTSFYLPFVLHPAFYDTYYYLTDYRMGGGRIFNHLAEFFARTTLYSSTYYVLTLIGLSVIGLLARYGRLRPRGLGWLLGLAFLAGLITTFFRPTWLQIGETDWIWTFFTAALVIAWFTPQFPPGERMVWLWFGGPMILALFFTAIPNTHVYSFFIPWTLLGGMMLGKGWAWLVRRVQVPAARWVAVPAAVALIAIFGFYEYWLFVYNGVEVLRTWPEHRPRGYWTVYDMPVEVAIFGFPNNNGWKVVADLYDKGTLRGNYATNARDVTAEWYTRGRFFCPGDDLNYFMLVHPVEPTLRDEYLELRNSIENEHELYGEVFVEGEPKLRIYQRTVANLEPRQLYLEDVEARFDQELATPRFERIGPVTPAMIRNPVNYRFGDSIWLRGYRFADDDARPGEVLQVTLYWETNEHIPVDYTVFAQVIDLNDLAKAGQSDRQPGCGLIETSTWLPGETIADRHRLVMFQDARPGTYTLIIGLYLGDERLPVYNADGEELGPQLELVTVEIH